MGLRARKSIKIMPGVRMTVTPRGMSVSAGVTGARVSANTRGQVTRTIGVPGTGVSHVTTSRVGGKAAPSARSGATIVPTSDSPSKPGLLAPKWEKELHAALRNGATGAEFYRIASTYPDAARPSAMFEALRVAIPSGDLGRARTLLGWLHGQAYDPASDAFVSRFAPGATVLLPIAPGISAEAPVSSGSLSLLLAELEQSSGDLASATLIVEALEPSTLAAVSLAELYAEQARWGDIVLLTEGVINDDEPSTYLLIQRGIALRETGYFEASRVALKEALRPRSRPAELRQVASIERGKTYLAEGKKALARKDFERVMGENSSFKGLRELLAASS